jgi:hypothetical protein
MMRHYIAQIIGSGSSIADPFRSVIEDIVPGVQSSSVDGRKDGTLASGWMLTSCDVSDAQHALIVLDARVSAIPLEDAGGVALSLDAPLADVPLTKRQQLLARCEADHVPVRDIGLAHTVRDVLKRVIYRCLLRQKLGDIDYTEGLNTLLSDIPAQRRNAIRARLITWGFDTSVIAGSDTVREALRKLIIQKQDATHLD